MIDILEFIDDLKELQKLYGMGDICHMDFQEKIQKYEDQVAQFEAQLEESV